MVSFNQCKTWGFLIILRICDQFMLKNWTWGCTWCKITIIKICNSVLLNGKLLSLSKVIWRNDNDWIGSTIYVDLKINWIVNLNRIWYGAYNPQNSKEFFIIFNSYYSRLIIVCKWVQACIICAIHKLQIILSWVVTIVPY